MEIAIPRLYFGLKLALKKKRSLRVDLRLVDSVGS